MIIDFFISLLFYFLDFPGKLSQKYLKGKSFYFSLTKFNIRQFLLICC